MELVGSRGPAVAVSKVKRTLLGCIRTLYGVEFRTVKAEGARHRGYLHTSIDACNLPINIHVRMYLSNTSRYVVHAIPSFLIQVLFSSLLSCSQKSDSARGGCLPDFTHTISKDRSATRRGVVFWRLMVESSVRLTSTSRIDAFGKES